jgi:hypothetical protein
MGNMIADDPADAVTTHPAVGNMPAQRDDKRGLLHMLHDEIGKAIGVGQAKDVPVGVVGSSGKAQGLMDAVDEAVSGAKNANPDNP